MKNKLVGVIIALVVILAIFLLLVYIGGNVMGVERLMTGENPMLRFAFVIVGLLIALGVYYGTKDSPAWEVGTRQVVWMAIARRCTRSFRGCSTARCFSCHPSARWRCARQSPSRYSSAMPSAPSSASSPARLATCSAMP